MPGPPATLRFPVAAALLSVALAGPCAAQQTRESVDNERARAHVDMLAGTIGSRPTGSLANLRAREYVLDQLQQYGFVVRVQEAEAIDSRRGVTARLANIIALREGQAREAIALVSHYDSVPDAPGAVDDALGVATCLEAARVLAKAPLRNSLLVLVTDGEELGLMGARAIVTDAQVAARMTAFLNFDGPAGAGMPLLFEASPGWGAPLDAWARSRTPSGASFAVEIYKRLPNDTDFTVLKANASGLNFAPLRDAYVYHTDRDQPRRVDAFTLGREIENTVDIVRALDSAAGPPRGDSPTYFDVADRYAFLYGSQATRTVAWAAGAGGTLAWLLLTFDLFRRLRWRLLLALPWSLLAAVAAIGVPIGATWVLRAIRGELNPWYASPLWYFSLLAATGLAAVWALSALHGVVPERWASLRTPAATWWATLPAWIVVTIFFYRAAPAASYLVAIPTVAAALLVSIAHRSVRVTRWASILLIVVVASLWADKMATMLALLVPLSGWLGVVMPAAAFPAVMGMAGLMTAPPMAAAVAGWRPQSSGRLVVALLAWLVVSAGLTLASPAYTADRPQRRAVRYVQDDVAHRAWWEVSGTERALGVDPRGLAGADWQPADGTLAATVRLPPVAGPVRFRTASEPVVREAPADVRSMGSTSARGRRFADIEIVPHENLTARVVLPRDLVPVESSLLGRVTEGQWSATYVSPPPEGIHVRLTFEAPAPDPLRLFVVLTTAGLPGGAGPFRLQLPWLSLERSTWSARSIHIVDASPTQP